MARKTTGRRKTAAKPAARKPARKPARKAPVRKTATKTRALVAAPAAPRKVRRNTATTTGKRGRGSGTEKMLREYGATGAGVAIGAVAGPALATAAARQIGTIAQYPVVGQAIEAGIPIGAGYLLRKRAPNVARGMIGIGIGLAVLAVWRQIRDRIPALAALDLGPLASPKVFYQPTTGRILFPAAGGAVALSRREVEQVLGAIPEQTLRLTDGRTVRGAVLGQHGDDLIVHSRARRKTYSVPVSGVVPAPGVSLGSIVAVPTGPRPLGEIVPRPTVGAGPRSGPGGLSRLNGPVSAFNRGIGY